MKKNFRILAIVALGATLVGCAAPKTGRDDATYYYSNKAASAVPKVEPAPPPAVQNGPEGVSKIVYFDFDKYNIKSEYVKIVEAHASYMRNRTSSRVVIEGNTDQRGGREYNLALGQRRADAVQRALTQLGVPAERIEAISWGTEKPASLATTEEGYQLNRRAEFSYR
ncbi:MULTISPECIES: peptidoglycan-associated lipoprotein Pal [Variovorax]|jgi:peptidoglycan-associated lipoprotein|uniref:peptidoglycan-associated lipoprotein Pal n=1 Tax=Variovorax TaxID=34072 RepID=UPI00086B6B1C|nr:MULTISPECIES: peptidoglycan-associated lipoprotein Pal [Variovorax]MBN8752555.1 peptidoglycan-associated lipoprotein Pal [Variovorax sp.]ODU16346.1 MAG: peptidoglycan-associated lipoprotein [Variovorax sp. SCN 67-85]ODV17012.1 MAG: peptidoglycan-associated lipoprotein [Variovorax sp. SCN 67-20]OJZ10165.1 MAG: peptidoglycan-associated lipoprotein [Variovorax sp. 67-131]UKI06790.1 peptidoglycan-associated lipoprotein Pal [Variovorax paradoxus]|eukprot:gene59826-79792_t